MVTCSRSRVIEINIITIRDRRLAYKAHRLPNVACQGARATFLHARSVNAHHHRPEFAVQTSLDSSQAGLSRSVRRSAASFAHAIGDAKANPSALAANANADERRVCVSRIIFSLGSHCPIADEARSVKTIHVASQTQNAPQGFTYGATFTLIALLNQASGTH